MIEVGSFAARVIYIDIDFKYMNTSKVTISSSDATWADGISKQLERLFNDNRVEYSPIVEHWYVKLGLSTVALFSLCWAFACVVHETARLMIPTYSLTPEKVFILIAVIGVFTLLWALYYFSEWLFPRLEYGNPAQKRIRKWIWATLVGSGLITTLVFKMLGL